MDGMGGDAIPGGSITIFYGIYVHIDDGVANIGGEGT